jgi:hypothetical protein
MAPQSFAPEPFDYTDLVEVSASLSDGVVILRRLEKNDTPDRVFGEALAAVKDARDHLEDAISALDEE